MATSAPASVPSPSAPSFIGAMEADAPPEAAPSLPSTVDEEFDEFVDPVETERRSSLRIPADDPVVEEFSSPIAAAASHSATSTKDAFEMGHDEVAGETEQVLASGAPMDQDEGSLGSPDSAPLEPVPEEVLQVEKEDDGGSQGTSSAKSRIQGLGGLMKARVSATASRMKAVASATSAEGKKVMARGLAAAKSSASSAKKRDDKKEGPDTEGSTEGSDGADVPKTMSFTSFVSSASSSISSREGGAELLAEEVPAVPDTLLWRNKEVCSNQLHDFELRRKQLVAEHVEDDRELWMALVMRMKAGMDANKKLRKFLGSRMEADRSYARGMTASLSSLSSSSATIDPTNGLEQTMQKLTNQSSKVAENLLQHADQLESEVLDGYLDKMVSGYEERVTALLEKGEQLDKELAHILQRELINFSDFDALFREMAVIRSTNRGVRKDLWLHEAKYSVGANRLRKFHQQYLAGMAQIVEEYKSLERNRIELSLKSISWYQKQYNILWSPVSSTEALEEQELEAEAELKSAFDQFPAKPVERLRLLQSGESLELFPVAKSALISPLVIKHGILKRKYTVAGITKNWKDCICIVTQDRFLHVIDLESQPEGQTKEDLVDTALLPLAIPAPEAGALKLFSGIEKRLSLGLDKQEKGEEKSSSPQNSGQIQSSLRLSVFLPHSQVSFSSTLQSTFEVETVVKAGTMMRMLGRTEGSSKQSFQCQSQNDAMDWVICLRQLTTS